MERVAVVGTCRTPFVRAGAQFADAHFVDLATAVTKGLLERTAVESGVIDELVLGSVLLDPRLPNAARELVLRAGLPKSLPAHFVSNNCISGLVAVSVIADGIRAGRISCGLAVGSESMSRPSLAFRPAAEQFFLRLSRARSIKERASILTTWRPVFLLPIPPSPKEPSTGLTMGEHCELMAKDFGITRLAQDQFALRSHMNASRAQQQGLFDDEVLPTQGVTKDTIVRGDTTMERLQKLRPVFDRSSRGTLTAGNSSSLTDGASAVLLMGESRARERGIKPLGFIERIEFSAVDPEAGLLMAPATCLPRLLTTSRLGVADIDLFEVHEAFAAQVLCNLRAWESGWSRYPDVLPIGGIPEEKLNVNGGSLALGHPFAATAGRLIGATLRELRRSNLRRAAVSICAAGAMAGAALLSSD